MGVPLAVKAFILNPKKELLIVKRTLTDDQSPGAWELPGGRVNEREDPFAALKREIMEETGLTITILNPLNVQYFIRDDGQPLTIIIFLCKTQHSSVTLSHEHSAYSWNPLESVKEKLASYYHKECDLYLTYFS